VSTPWRKSRTGLPSPLPEAKAGQHLRKVEDLWPLAGKLLVAERLRLNTRRLTTVWLEQPVLSNLWWTVSLKEKRSIDQNSKTLALWLNSTLGLIALIANREETEGPWIDFKKPVLKALPVLDVTLLSGDQRRELASAYDRLADQTLQPFPQMAGDPVRAEIDAAIAQALGLPDFSVLRTLLAQEPIICLERL